ncbi:MAG TPA: adenylyl-sulfate kinase, partial [Nocardioidaceae bacterium]
MPDSTPALPQYSPAPRELDDLELLSHGALAPLTGFEGPGGLVTLHVPADVAAAATSAGALELVDPEGVPLATVTVDSVYDVEGADRVGIAGPVTPITHNEFGAFRRLFLSPAQVHDRYGEGAVTVPVAGPLTTADLDRVRDEAGDAPVVLLTLVGTGTPDLPAPALIRATLKAAEHLADAHVVAVPLASRGDAALDHELGKRVVEAYAPAEVVAVTGEGDLPVDVEEIVDAALPGPDEQGLVLFFTGLSGSGKSTLARALHDVVLEQGERTVTSLDGDVVRRNLSKGLTFSKEDRETNIRRIGWVAAEISRHGGVAICSPIAPFDSTRKQVRAMVEDAGGAFVLIHVATPLEECERRD